MLLEDEDEEVGGVTGVLFRPLGEAKVPPRPRGEPPPLFLWLNLLLWLLLLLPPSLFPLLPLPRPGGRPRPLIGGEGVG